MKTFTIELTKQQTKTIQMEWNEGGVDGGLILAQAVVNLGPFQAGIGRLVCTIISMIQRKKIQSILKK